MAQHLLYSNSYKDENYVLITEQGFCEDKMTATSVKSVNMLIQSSLLIMHLRDLSKVQLAKFCLGGERMLKIM